MEHKSNHNLQNSIFVWRLWMLVCSPSHWIIYGNIVYTFFIGLNKRLCNTICEVTNNSILVRRVLNWNKMEFSWLIYRENKFNKEYERGSRSAILVENVCWSFTSCKRRLKSWYSWYIWNVWRTFIW